MMRGGVSLGAVILSVLSISATRCSDNFSTERCDGRVVTIRLGAQLECDLEPPQQLNVTFTDKVWCDLHGGRFKGNSLGLCRDIDY